MSTQTSALPDGTKLTKPASGERVSLSVINANTDNIANNIIGLNNKINTNVGSKQYNLGALSSATIANQALAFCSAHTGESNFVGSFYLTASAVPSDLPAQTNEWKYAYGMFRIRLVNNSNISDGDIILFGWKTNNIAIRNIANSEIAESWSQLALTSQIEKTGYNMNQWFSALEDTDNSAYMWAQGNLRVITFQGKRRTHTEDEVLFTLPAEHRPAMTVRCAGSYNGVSVVISLNTDGTGVLFVANGQTATGRIYFSAAFMH